MIDDYRLKRLHESCKLKRLKAHYVYKLIRIEVRRKHQRQIMEELKTREEELKRLKNDQLVTTLIDSGT